MAIVFLIVLLLIKNRSRFFNNIENPGLVYGENTLVELVGTDADGDGVLDWEESLWGTNPDKTDTNDDGIEDGAEVARLKTEFEASREGDVIAEENLTETDKFSRELFTTIVALNQAGEVDQVTADKLSESLVEQIKNAAPRKVFLISEIKVIDDNSASAMQIYINTISNMNKKYPPAGNVLDILQEFVGNGETENPEVLVALDPIIERTSNIVNEMMQMNVPSEIAQLHLDFVNIMERLVENLNDIRLFDTDSIVALGAISQYETNITVLNSTTIELGNLIKQKLNN